VIGDFSTLFGKSQGVTLQNWCISYGLPLVWTIAIPNAYFGSFSHPFVTGPQNQSFIDPIVFPTSSIANISSEDQATTMELFSMAWKYINITLEANPSIQNNTGLESFSLHRISSS